MHLRGCGVAVGAVLLASLAACGGGSSSADSSSPMPITRSVSRSSAALSPSATRALDPNSDAAIIAGVRAWAAGLTAATNEASLTPLKSAATARCSCLQAESQAIAYLTQNHLHLTARYAVTAAAVLSRDSTGALVSATVASPAYQAIRSDGTVFKTESGDSSTSKYSLKLVGSQWLVDTVI